MPQQTLYPRGTLKKIVKAHSNKPLSKNVDILIFLNYTLFLQDLMREASISAKQNRSGTRGGAGITARDVRKVREGVLRKYKG
ncbi:hypothetical protein GQ43DRAFT_413013 [Delitschia confertaspora ATCC 74209]|uniref:Transcription factor CBF/NF-Y/archaeal histone domain-containing protein n=1 Tax=Delitschia confertaspora ATCC 74209 TaxID=1513339 RepID=A0A9P4MX24_9PLEO|nr:hypothetical protein GQ43DRAFT_413013 [Delitschia confertaspora ATCC 74209]